MNFTLVIPGARLRGPGIQKRTMPLDSGFARQEASAPE
jgi:hypothetical protein